MEKEFYALSEIAERLKLGKRRVYQLVHEGKIPSIRRGRTILVPAAAWQTYLDMQKEIAISSLKSVDGDNC